MNLSQIKEAHEAGKTVCWKNSLYKIVCDRLGQWFIKCTANNHLIGLTHRDGVTMNGKEEDFYIFD